MVTAAARRRGVLLTGVVLLYLGLSLAWTFPVWTAREPVVPTVPLQQFAPDFPTYVWLLGWVPYAIAHGWSPFSSGWLNAPLGANVAYPGPPLPLTVLMWPVTLLVGPVRAYDVSVVVGIVLSCVAAWWSCRVWVGSGWGPLVCGAMFGFSPYVLGQVQEGHLNLMLAACVPLSSVLFREAIVLQRRKPRLIGGLTGSLGALQILTSQELAVIVALTTILVGFALALRYPQEVRLRWIYVVRVCCWAIPFVVVAVGIVVWAEMLSPGAVHGPLTVNSTQGASDALTLLSPSYGELLTLPVLVKAQLISNSLPNEALGYVGVPAAVVLFTLARQPGRATRWFVGVGALAALLMLGPTLHIGGLDTGVPLPMDLLSRLPLLSDLVASRMSVVVDWIVALCLGAFVQRLAVFGRMRTGVVLAALAVATWVPNLPVSVAAADTPSYFFGVHVPSSESLFVVPYAQTSLGAISEVWQASADFRFKMTGGYYLRSAFGGAVEVPFGPVPSPLTEAVVKLMHGVATVPITDQLRRASREYVSFRRVWGIAVGPSGMESAEVRFFTSLLCVRPRWVGRVAVWHVSLTCIGRKAP